MTLTEKVNAIKALAPRIRAMLDIAQEWHSKQIHIGNPIKDAIGTRSDLTTDGIHHGIGIYTDRRKVWGRNWFADGCGYPYAFGIEGGGASGYGLEINAEGEIVRGMPDEYGSAEKKMQYLIDNFDEYEARFYSFANNINNK